MQMLLAQLREKVSHKGVYLDCVSLSTLENQVQILKAVTNTARCSRNISRTHRTFGSGASTSPLEHNRIADACGEKIQHGNSQVFKLVTGARSLTAQALALERKLP